MMKLSHLRSPRRSGFTLVELLVVIAIIAILAGVTVVAVGTAINAAKRAKANVTANSIQTAVLNYYTEYSVYPVVAQATPVDTLYNDKDGTDWAALVSVLSGNIHPSTGQPTNLTVLNTREIPYLTLKSSDVFSSTSTTGTPDAPIN